MTPRTSTTNSHTTCLDVTGRCETYLLPISQRFRWRQAQAASIGNAMISWCPLRPSIPDSGVRKETKAAGLVTLTPEARQVSWLPTLSASSQRIKQLPALNLRQLTNPRHKLTGQTRRHLITPPPNRQLPHNRRH